ncbi:kinase-like domain-containing protein [Pilobolus umbonatus]|nr:kinase-like domain-containing protein [Pilobolus umbonatus]
MILMNKLFGTPFDLHRRWQEIRSATNSKNPIIGHQYELLRDIAQGASTVHLALDVKTNKYYAVKELNRVRLERQYFKELMQLGPRRSTSFTRDIQESYDNKDILNDTTPVQDFLMKEYILMAELGLHKNVIKVIKVIIDPEYENSIFIVMEYAEKGVVMDLTANSPIKPYSETECRSLFRQLVDAVDHLHLNGIIHRDIKPQNLLLTNDNTVKLIDFGTSAKVSSRASYHHGTPAFTAPEIIKKVSKENAYMTAADVWAMGVTLYCLIHGCLPFPKNNIIELYDEILYQKVTHPRPLDKDLTDLIERMLEKNPENRITIESIRCHPWLNR